MSVKLKIKVTKAILEKSKYCGVHGRERSIATNCAVAVAVRDIWPDAAVCNEFIAPTGTTYDGIIGLPYEAYRYINLFDNSTPKERPLLPELEFEIEIPDSVVEKINIEELKPLLVNHPTLQII